MSTPGAADPAVYSSLRERVLQIRLPNLAADAIHAVLMDWPLAGGSMTVLAAADGTASIYLSSGGGFLGGSQASPAIREAALAAVGVAAEHRKDVQPVTYLLPPMPGIVAFYLTTNEGVLGANMAEVFIQNGMHPLTALAAAMQNIVTEYRLWDEQRQATA